jgi:hypothetical protein
MMIMRMKVVRSAVPTYMGMECTYQDGKTDDIDFHCYLQAIEANTLASTRREMELSCSRGWVLPRQ